MNYEDLREWLLPLGKTPGRYVGADDLAHSAVLAAFTRIDGELCLLLERRGAAIPQGGEISFPGGAVDPGDSGPEETVVREAVEELGIEASRIRVDAYLGNLTAPLGALVDVFVGFIEARGREDFSPNRDEVEALLFVPFSWFLTHEPEKFSLELEMKSRRRDGDGREEVLFPAREMGLPERYWSGWAGRPHAVYVYRWEDQVIWGMTAQMIRALANLRPS